MSSSSLLNIKYMGKVRLPSTGFYWQRHVLVGCFGHAVCLCSTANPGKWRGSIDMLILTKPGYKSLTLSDIKIHSWTYQAMTPNLLHVHMHVKLQILLDACRSI